MKRCSHCGREYSGGIDVCPIDSAPLEQVPPGPPTADLAPSPSAPKPNQQIDAAQISSARRFFTLAAVWAVGIAITALAVGAVRFSSPADFLLGALLFPLGIAALTGSPLGLPIGWLSLLWLSGAVVFAKRRKAFTTAFVLLCALLLLNAAGCYVQSVRIPPGKSIM